MADLSDKNNQGKSIDLEAAVKFDAAEFEQRLAETRQEFDQELKRSVLYKEPAQHDVPLNFNIPGATERPGKEIKKAPEAEEEPQSGFLASLAQEAKQTLQNRGTLDQEKQDRNQQIHAALERLVKFFVPFIKHVNAVAPSINRVYRLDARSTFANLKWKDALVDSRKLNMSESSLLNYVSFSVNLQAPEPVILKRPWEQFDALVKELSHFKIRPLDDLHALRKRPQTEWLETKLDPALPVQIHFQGNYEQGKVDVLTRNLQDFGQSVFRLEPADITNALLEELGMFLIARSDQLPEKLRKLDK